MFTPETSKHFKRVVDEKSGVPHYVLETKLVAYQQGFYFVNNSMTCDGRYLWFYAIINPVYTTFERNLGYVDFLTDEVVICYDALVEGASPYVDPETGDVYFTRNSCLYKREPVKDKMAVKLCSVDIPGYVRNIVCHLTRLSDKKSFFLDIGRDDFGFIQGTLNSETGEFIKWGETSLTANHGQINPKNDKLALFGIDTGDDLKTGAAIHVPHSEDGIYERLWTVTADGEYTMHPPRNNYATHEWWSADGEKIYYVNDLGIQRKNLKTGEHICVHECYPWHAHTTADEKLYIYDEKVLDRFGGRWFRGCPAAVRFYNKATDKEITVVTEMPENDFNPKNQCEYHIDPHPRFTENEKYVVFTTTELGSVDLALASVDELLALTK
ncbi:MAG: hypothetical protein IJE25_07120 [Clostridia bacterium]|nr:hypothetical protein [Clostridia bacterium]